MRKKLLITLLPLLGAVVMVGSAYSAWVFTNSDAINKTINGAVTVTPIADTLDFKWTSEVDSFTLELDQGGINNTATNVGISSSLDTNDNAFTFSLTKDENLNLDDYYVTLDYSLTISAGGDYITLANGTDGMISNGEETIYLAENATAVQDKLSYEYSANTWNFKVDATASDGKVFHYATGKKPTTAEAYNSMSSYYVEQSNTVTLFFTATINVIDKATA